MATKVMDKSLIFNIEVPISFLDMSLEYIAKERVIKTVVVTDLNHIYNTDYTVHDLDDFIVSENLNARVGEYKLSHKDGSIYFLCKVKQSPTNELKVSIENA